MLDMISDEAIPMMGPRVSQLSLEPCCWGAGSDHPELYPPARRVDFWLWEKLRGQDLFFLTSPVLHRPRGPWKVSPGSSFCPHCFILNTFPKTAWMHSLLPAYSSSCFCPLPCGFLQTLSPLLATLSLPGGYSFPPQHTPKAFSLHS